MKPASKTIEALNQRLLRLIVRKQELLGPEYSRLNARYQIALGSIESQLESVGLELRKIQRKSELMEQYGAEQVLDEDRLETLLMFEFYPEEVKLMEHQRTLERSRDFLGPKLSALEMEQLRQRFSEMVYKLHPAFQAEHSEEHAELLAEVYAAFEHSDIAAMAELYVSIEDMQEPGASAEQLKAQIDALETEIESIREDYPYKYQYLLQDEVQLAERQSQLYAQLRAAKEELEAWTNRYNMLYQTAVGPAHSN